MMFWMAARSGLQSPSPFCAAVFLAISLLTTPGDLICFKRLIRKEKKQLHLREEVKRMEEGKELRCDCCSHNDDVLRRNSIVFLPAALD
jgi:hypothetical protein